MQLGNMIAMGLRAVAFQTLGIRRPVNVMLAVTNRCNGRCAYCRIPSRSNQDMPLDKICGLIDEMKAAGAIRLGLWGGEPLMREDIGDIVSHAKQKGMYVTMDTNALLWQTHRHVLKDLDHVVMALDGCRSGHEANRGQGTFDKVMEALETASSTPGLKVWTLTVLTRNNLGDIDFILDTAKRLKIHAAFQTLHHNDILGANHEDLLPGDEQYKDAIRHLLHRKREGARISASSRYLNYLLKWDGYATVTRKEPHLNVMCKAGAMYCNVDADGKVYACSLLIEKGKAENALDVGFKKAFDAIPPLPCQACTAACFTEYNYLYSLDPICIAEWIRTTRG